MTRTILRMRLAGIAGLVFLASAVSAGEPGVAVVTDQPTAKGGMIQQALAEIFQVSEASLPPAPDPCAPQCAPAKEECCPGPVQDGCCERGCDQNCWDRASCQWGSGCRWRNRCQWRSGCSRWSWSCDRGTFQECFIRARVACKNAGTMLAHRCFPGWFEKQVCEHGLPYHHCRQCPNPNFCRHGKKWSDCDHCERPRHFGRWGYFRGHRTPWMGLYHMVYPVRPNYSDPRDAHAYAAAGMGVPMTVPLAPVVGHTYNYSWGIPASRVTPIYRRAPAVIAP